MKVGDLVKCKEPMLSEIGLGLVIQKESYEDDRLDRSSVCVLWATSEYFPGPQWYWYHEEDLEIISNS